MEARAMAPKGVTTNDTLASAMSLRPFFCYYGGKWRAAPKYPPPEHGTIIEPFAGAAGYATRHPDRQVILVERDPVIAALWRYLIRVSPKEIRGLPDVPTDGSTDDLNVCQEARSLIGFWLNKGTAGPRKTPSMWMRNADNAWASGQAVRSKSFWGPVVRERIAYQVEAIRHWQIIEGSYEDAPAMPATWFIDPPYQVAGRNYRLHLSPDDYTWLAEWCRAREGQVIVCLVSRICG
jgi:hypothetical protein